MTSWDPLTIFRIATADFWAIGGATLATVYGSVFEDPSFWRWSILTSGIICSSHAVASFFILPADKDAIAEGKKCLPLTSRTSSLAYLVFFAWNQTAVPNRSVPYTCPSYRWILPLIVLRMHRNKHCSIASCFDWESLAGGGICSQYDCLWWPSFGIWLYYLFQWIEQARHQCAISAAAQNSSVAITGLITFARCGTLAP